MDVAALVRQLQGEDWRTVGASGEPGFENGWVNYDPAYNLAQFRRSGPRSVRLRGLVKSGAFNVAAFTLPPGYRPEKIEVIVVDSNLAHGRVNVQPNGVVAPWTGSPIYFSLDNVEFDVPLG